MKRKVGLWIDHRKAVIVSLTGDHEKIISITSEMEKHVRFSGGAQKDTEEDSRDRRFTNHLNKYYDEVMNVISDADSVLVFGPGEAKVELKNLFESNKSVKCEVDIDTTDKMTEHQIAAKVREHFGQKI